MRLHAKLNQLKFYFDSIERYSSDENLGFRSLNNMGVWLLVFALVDEKEREEMFEEFFAKANLAQLSEQVKAQRFKGLKDLVNELTTPDNIKEVITAYCEAGGTLEINIPNPAYRNKLITKAKELGLGELIEKHYKESKEDSTIVAFKMKNAIQFKWRGFGHRETVECPELKLEDGELYHKTDNENHNIDYGLIPFDNDSYAHVVRLGTSEGPDFDFTDPYALPPALKASDVFLLKPTNPQKFALMQQRYFDLIRQFEKHEKDLYVQQHDFLCKQKIDGLNITDKRKVKGKPTDNPYVFELTVRFPVMKGELETTEHRLGAYGLFSGRSIGTLPVGDSQYNGVRALKYDSKGGEVRNKEEYIVQECMHIPQPKEVKTQVTIKAPFFLVYKSPEGRDYYPFQVANPKKALKHTFEARATYDGDEPRAKQERRMK